ncbi:MAG TPA: glycogen debranching N-terminal domain-containing protein [Gaiellaceae bacterium]|nr:glycogen debranching N-terminal domain-containing protein [Gaiellaceae bacterium]
MAQLTILEGSTFCISDELGDVRETTHGLFAEDTRFLSRLCLTIDGRRPLLLSSGTVEYFSAAFFLRNPLTDGLPLDSVAVRRERFVGDGMQDHVVVENETMGPLRLTLGLEFGADFADIMSVKEWDFSLGDPTHATPLPEPVEAEQDGDRNQYVLSDRDGFGRTQVILSQRGVRVAGGVEYEVALGPRQRWELRVDVVTGRPGKALRAPRGVVRHFGEERARVRASLDAWQLHVPRIETSWDELEHAFGQSVNDLAALRMRTAEGDGLSRLPAAGMPWFMTVFGRDTLITSLQTLLFGPELARGALRELAALQAKKDDPSRDAEPGKIVHEVRRGKAAVRWFDRYYGTVDATPLFLILLSEVWRWTDDEELVADLRGPALAALRWIDEYGDRDGDGFVEYERRTPRGLENQSWKDSGDSQRFRDGRVARPPIAPCEVQGYVYDAKMRMVELAREAWDDAELAERLEREAETLRARFDERFWVDRRGGYYALALDGEKQRVDALCSNMGHLLWSGIVPEHRVDAVVGRLLGDELWSGWGIRTMSTADAAYSPLSYHNGTVWPHDTSLCAAGLARYGRWAEAHRIVRALLDAAHTFGFQLPEVFAGLPRAETPFPIAYPTAARPQAWAAGTPVLLLQVLLGLRPDRRRRRIETVAPAGLPSWAGTIRLSGVRAFDRVWDVQLDDGRVRVKGG